jgi:hypothetical protein
VVITLGLAGTIPLFASDAGAGRTGYYRYPAVHGDTLLFTSEGDLWAVSVHGGLASRLTSNTGIESMTTISPDGQTVAFRAQYEGPRDVYTMPIHGGLPQRRTWSSGALPEGWTPDGRLMVSTTRYSTLPYPRLVLLGSSGQIEVVALAGAAEAAYLPDGHTLIFTRWYKQSSFTKRYKAGAAENLWSYDGHIVYSCAGALWSLDLHTSHDVILPITLQSDFDQLSERWVKKPLDSLTDVHIAPDGGSADFTARGEVFTLPARTGRIIKVAGDSNTRYASARFMPDGKSIVALSTQSGEAEFWKYPANGLGTPQQWTHDAKILRWDGLPSSTDTGSRTTTRTTSSGSTTSRPATTSKSPSPHPVISLTSPGRPKVNGWPTPKPPAMTSSRSICSTPPPATSTPSPQFPPGISKWNKIEHRLFSFLSSNWRGEPLRDDETIVNLISRTTTAKGLRVTCRLDRRKYPTGRKVTDEEMSRVNLKQSKFHGEWNYTIHPTTL